MYGNPKSLHTCILFAAVALTGLWTAGPAASDQTASPGRSGEPSDNKLRFVAGDIDTLPRIQFADGLISLNDRCPVRRVPLNLRMPPVYVNGRPVGFC